MDLILNEQECLEITPKTPRAIVISLRDIRVDYSKLLEHNSLKHVEETC